jgi:hypothetical protein
MAAWSYIMQKVETMAYYKPLSQYSVVETAETSTFSVYW